LSPRRSKDLATRHLLGQGDRIARPGDYAGLVVDIHNAIECHNNIRLCLTDVLIPLINRGECDVQSRAHASKYAYGLDHQRHLSIEPTRLLEHILQPYQTPTRCQYSIVYLLRLIIAQNRTGVEDLGGQVKIDSRKDQSGSTSVEQQQGTVPGRPD
jgi:hypothetical protein